MDVGLHALWKGEQGREQVLVEAERPVPSGDRPGQRATDLVLVVLMAEHTIEEAKFANIRLAGNFFREFIAPVATRYRERIDHEAILAAGGREPVGIFWDRDLGDAVPVGFRLAEGAVLAVEDIEIYLR